MESTSFVNKVQESGLITLDLDQFYPNAPIKIFDLKGYLFMELILKEKDFRAALLSTDWTTYQGASVAIHCSIDAIIPMWAYMLIASYLQPVAADIVFGSEKDLVNFIMLKNLDHFDVSEFVDKRVVVKGCGDRPIPEIAYVSITNKLRPLVKSIMYGEPCSTVPIFKKPNPLKVD